MGVKRLSLFGSAARGDAGTGSDVDLAAEFARPFGMFQFAHVEGRLRELLGRQVDLVGEPARKTRMRQAIDRDRVRAF